LWVTGQLTTNEKEESNDDDETDWNKDEASPIFVVKVADKTDATQ